ncbi:hypothetical protein XAB3213_1690003 [Xanthomonas citri pv. bilvae]|nr:hypothetical protein XAB3213_1690003 [Xanthomonas citri pv. bilvae]
MDWCTGLFAAATDPNVAISRAEAVSSYATRLHAQDGKNRSAQDTIDTRLYRSRRCASLDASYGTLAHTAMECCLALCLAQCLQAHAHNHADGMTCRRAAPKSGGLAPSKQGATSS